MTKTLSLTAASNSENGDAFHNDFAMCTEGYGTKCLTSIIMMLVSTFSRFHLNMFDYLNVTVDYVKIH